MADSELEYFLLKVMSVIDACIMDRVTKGFFPTFMVNNGPDLDMFIYGTERLPVTRVTRKHEMEKMAAQARFEGVVDPLAMAACALFEDGEGSRMILVCAGDRTMRRFGLAMVEVDHDGVLSIKEASIVPDDFDATRGFGGATKNLIGLIDIFYEAFDGTA